MEVPQAFPQAGGEAREADGQQPERAIIPAHDVVRLESAAATGGSLSTLVTSVRAVMPFVMGVTLGLAFAFRCFDRFAGAGHDDTFITLLAAEQLASGAGFVTPNGEPGEIGSSVLHVVVLAALSWLRVPDLYLANKLAGFLFGTLTLLCVVQRRAAFFEASSMPLAAAAVAAAWAMWLPTYAFWTMGGLETPMVALLLTWLVALLREETSARATGIVAFLLTLARPEGFAYLGVVGLVGVVLRRRGRWWGEALAAPLVLFSCVSLARYLWLGSVFPLPVLAKAGGASPWNRLEGGLEYLVAFARASWAGPLFVGAAVLRSLHLGWLCMRGKIASQATGTVAAGLVASAHLGVVLVSGGDWMAFYRFVAPVVPLLSVVFVQWLFATLEPRSRTLRGSLVVCLLLAIPSLTREKSGLSPPFMHNTCLQQSFADLFYDELGASLGERIRRLNHPYWRDEGQLRPFLIDWLEPLVRVRGPITMATYQMGFLPYELRPLGLRDVRLIDTFGIVDPVLARMPGAREPRGLKIGISPELFLDPNSTDPIAREIQARRPDLLYVLSIQRDAVARLASWGWVLVWDAPEAKVFARAEMGFLRNAPIVH